MCDQLCASGCKLTTLIIPRCRILSTTHQAHTEAIVAEAAALAEEKRSALTTQLGTLEQAYAGMQSGVTFCNNVLRDASTVEVLTIKSHLLGRLKTITSDDATLPKNPVVSAEIQFSSTADAALPDLLRRVSVGRPQLRHVFTGSVILTEASPPEQHTALCEWVSAALGRPNDPLVVQLLYRGSRDGFDPAAFQRCCDNRGKTVTLIRTADGTHVFGAFCAAPFSCVNQYVDSKESAERRSFLFSLRTASNDARPERFPLKAGCEVHEIYMHSGYSLTLGGGRDLIVTSTTVTFNPHSYALPSNTRLAGAARCTISEIETFSVRL